MREVIDHYGRLDVLVNCAGIIQVGPMEHMALEDYEAAMDVHFRGPLHTMMAALPYMRHQHGGRIVNIASIGGKVPVPHLVPYAASKFALVGLSSSLRAELAHEDILVTTVSPGLMRTGSPLNASMKGRHDAEYAWFAIADALPGLSVAASRAAGQIVEACRRGRAELVITVQAKLAILGKDVAPELIARRHELRQRTAAAAGVGRDGDVARRGSEGESEWADPSARLTAPTYKAADENNEMSACSG